MCIYIYIVIIYICIPIYPHDIPVYLCRVAFFSSPSNGASKGWGHTSWPRRIPWSRCSAWERLGAWRCLEKVLLVVGVLYTYIYIYIYINYVYIYTYIYTYLLTIYIYINYIYICLRTFLLILDDYIIKIHQSLKLLTSPGWIWLNLSIRMKQPALHGSLHIYVLAGISKTIKRRVCFCINKSSKVIQSGGILGDALEVVTWYVAIVEYRGDIPTYEGHCHTYKKKTTNCTPKYHTRTSM